MLTKIRFRKSVLVLKIILAQMITFCSFEVGRQYKQLLYFKVSSVSSSYDYFHDSTSNQHYCLLSYCFLCEVFFLYACGCTMCMPDVLEDKSDQIPLKHKLQIVKELPSGFYALTVVFFVCLSVCFFK